MMNNKQKNELLKLADELESGDIEFDEFRFDRFTGVLKCGTVGCALGHFAVRHPEWEIDEKGVPYYTSINGVGPIGDASKYFSLPYELAELMFVPEVGQKSIIEPLPADATPGQAARQIRTVIDHYENNY